MAATDAAEAALIKEKDVVVNAKCKSIKQLLLSYEIDLILPNLTYQLSAIMQGG